MISHDSARVKIRGNAEEEFPVLKRIFHLSQSFPVAGECLNPERNFRMQRDIRRSAAEKQRQFPCFSHDPAAGIIKLCSGVAGFQKVQEQNGRTPGKRLPIQRDRCDRLKAARAGKFQNAAFQRSAGQSQGFRSRGDYGECTGFRRQTQFSGVAENAFALHGGRNGGRAAGRRRFSAPDKTADL